MPRHQNPQNNHGISDLTCCPLIEEMFMQEFKFLKLTVNFLSKSANFVIILKENCYIQKGIQWILVVTFITAILSVYKYFMGKNMYCSKKSIWVE